MRSTHGLSVLEVIVKIWNIPTLSKAMCAAHKKNKAPDFFPLRNKLFMPNMKNGTILDTEKK